MDFVYTFLENLIVVLIFSRYVFSWKISPENFSPSLKVTPVLQRLQYDLFNISVPLWRCTALYKY